MPKSRLIRLPAMKPGKLKLEKLFSCKKDSKFFSFFPYSFAHVIGFFKKFSPKNPNFEL